MTVANGSLAVPAAARRRAGTQSLGRSWSVNRQHCHHNLIDEIRLVPEGGALKIELRGEHQATITFMA
jgi:hypothetical protein